MKILLAFCLLFVLNGCDIFGGGDSDDDSNGSERTTENNDDTGERPGEDGNDGNDENDNGNPSPNAALVVTKALLSELQLGVSENAPSSFARYTGMAFIVEAPDSEVCQSLKTYIDHYGVADCSNACEENVLVRSCSEKTVVNVCANSNFEIAYGEHELRWDVSNVGDQGAGLTEFNLAAAGKVSEDGRDAISFKCSMMVKAHVDRSTNVFACGNNFDMSCEINGESRDCAQLVELANGVRSCAKNRR